jgi:hypothetical protein
MTQPDELVSAWVELVGRGVWDWFVTLTFREPVHPESAGKRFREFLARVQAVRDVRSLLDQPAVLWLCAMERQQRGVIHFHVLLGNVQVLSYALVRESWTHGFSWVERIARAEDVARYCAKYVLKGGELELGVGVDQSSRWPLRVMARRKLGRALAALTPVERAELVEWALRDRRPSRRPGELLERARAGAERVK